MTWDSFGVASRELAVLVADSGYEPDLILAIARGGLLAAGALGYALAVKNLYTMNVEFYTGVDARLPVPMILPPVPDLVELRFARILVVDDVADTGHTLKIVQEFLKVESKRFDLQFCMKRVILSCGAIMSGNTRINGSIFLGQTRTRLSREPESLKTLSRRDQEH